MNFLKLLAIVAVAGVGYHVWHKQQTQAEAAPTTAISEFVEVPAPAGLVGHEVLILAPKNCPSDAAQRADAMARELAERDIPVTRSDNVSWNISAPEPEAIARINTLMAGEIPTVFVNGKAKANPSLEEVLREYQAGRDAAR
jgi:hypothetical protein